MGLLKSVPMYEGESYIGYIHRLTDANYYTGIHYVAEILNTSVKDLQRQLPSREFIHLLSGITGTSAQQIWEGTFHSIREKVGIEIGKKLTVQNNFNFCPYCLEESYYHRLEWNYYHVNICHKHNVFLTNRCPSCFTRLTFEMFSRGHCTKCQKSILRMHLRQVDSDKEKDISTLPEIPTRVVIA